uniref:Uncharacterized protein n=1 Tax=Caenorhabditis japonica TaxID=281687 RepID=A0A8R1I407_CAEJA
MFLRAIGYLLFCCISRVFTALPACASGVTCPKGGIWSEWKISGDTYCPTKCGSCSKLFYVRHCLSEDAKCKCTGPTTQYLPCNTVACQFPAQRTCCVPFVTVLVNGTMHCGPFSKEKTEGTEPCCPGAGIWTEWTEHFYKNDARGTYQKTRQCLSAPAGCPCTGAAVQEQIQCPCPRTLKTAESCMQIDTSLNVDYKIRWHRDLIVTDMNCTAIMEMESNDDQMTYGGPKMCKTLGPYIYVPALVLLLSASETQGPSNKCYVDRPFDCEARRRPENFQPVTFTCDLEKLLWKYDYHGWYVEGYNQLSFNSG